MSVHNDSVSGGLDFAREVTVGGVVLQEVSVGLCIGQIVHGDDFQDFGIVFKYSFEGLAPNATEAVDAYTSCHRKCSPFRCPWLTRWKHFPPGHRSSLLIWIDKLLRQ